MVFVVHPLSVFDAVVDAPPSKPETQRAVLLASLAAGRSRVSNALRSRETDAMVASCGALGARLTWEDNGWTIDGCGFRPGHRVPGGALAVRADGSGLVARIFAALGAVVDGGAEIDGNEVLRGRVMAPLFDALAAAGVPVAYRGRPGHLPITVGGVGFPGGRFDLPGDVSSQFATALMAVAPFGAAPTEIRMTRPVHSAAYLAQTAAALTRAGIDVAHADDFARITVTPGVVRPCDTACGGDFTSASYLVAAAAILPSRLVLRGLAPDSLQGERSILETVAAMGVEIVWSGDTVTVANPTGRLVGDFHVDVMDGPNIVPTLAAIGAFVEGSLTVTGGALTRLHKSDRIDAMVSELRRLGVDIAPLERHGRVDGFTVRGRPGYEGGVDLADHGDHRNFMSLFVASLRCRRPNRIHGQLDVAQSYPDFLRAFEAGGYPASNAAAE